MTVETLEQLLAPVTPEEFFSDYFGKKPLHVPGTPEKFRGLMDWDTLNEMLRRTEFWTSDNFRLVKQGNHAPPPVYCRPTPPSVMRQVMRPAWDLVQPNLKAGATIALYFVQSMTEPLRELTSMLESEVHGRLQMNIYCSWVREQGLHPHFDTHDVFAFHIEGKKEWRVYDDPIDRPVAHDMFEGDARKRLDAKKRDVYLKPMMEPGSFLYIPRGWYHEARGLTDGCFHIAAGMHYPVGLDVLTTLWNRLSADPAFRSRLALPTDDGGEAALEAQLEEMANAAADVFRQPDVLKEIVRVRDTFRTEKFPADLPASVVGNDSKKS
ncbi:MAG: cupin domain-containing protein [Rhodospirillales bacterium]